MKNGYQGGCWQAILGGLALLVPLAGASRAQGVIDLTGIWYDKDSVTYIRQVGGDVWWMQKSNDKKSYVNVFHGKLNGARLTGQWADVPAGKARDQGKINAAVVVKGEKAV